jgi:hypothetical protein
MWADLTGMSGATKGWRWALPALVVELVRQVLPSPAGGRGGGGRDRFSSVVDQRLDGLARRSSRHELDAPVVGEDVA